MEMEGAVKKRLIFNGVHVDDFYLTAGRDQIHMKRKESDGLGDLRPDIDKLLEKGAVQLR